MENIQKNRADENSSFASTLGEQGVKMFECGYISAEVKDIVNMQGCHRYEFPFDCDVGKIEKYNC